MGRYTAGQRPIKLALAELGTADDVVGHVEAQLAGRRGATAGSPAHGDVALGSAGLEAGRNQRHTGRVRRVASFR